MRLAAAVCALLSTLILACGAASAAPKVGKGQYDKVKDGMAYKQVREALGFGGEENASSTAGGVTTVIMTWANADGSNMNVTFQNGKVVAKAQFGLPDGDYAPRRPADEPLAKGRFVCTAAELSALGRVDGRAVRLTGRAEVSAGGNGARFAFKDADGTTLVTGTLARTPAELEGKVGAAVTLWDVTLEGRARRSGNAVEITGASLAKSALVKGAVAPTPKSQPAAPAGTAKEPSPRLVLARVFRPEQLAKEPRVNGLRLAVGGSAELRVLGGRLFYRFLAANGKTLLAAADVTPVPVELDGLVGKDPVSLKVVISGFIRRQDGVIIIDQPQLLKVGEKLTPLARSLPRK